MATMYYKQGMKGLPMIGRIQKALGCYPDNIFGPNTREAVLRYQKDMGLKQDGIVGPATLALLGLKEVANAVYNQTTPASSRSASPLGSPRTQEGNIKRRGFSKLGKLINIV